MTSWTYSSVHSAMHFNIYNACIKNCYNRETIYASLKGAKYTMIKMQLEKLKQVRKKTTRERKK